MTNQPNNPMTKMQLRKQAISQRVHLPVAEISEAICAQLSQWEPFQTAEQVLFYHPFRGEVDLRPLWRSFSAKKWFLPVLFPEHSSYNNAKRISESCSNSMGMHFRRADSDQDLKPGQYGIYEPDWNAEPWTPSLKAESRALILIPGVAFDPQGYRLGYGKGYYDRFLGDSSIRKGLSDLVGVTFSNLIVPNVLPEKWDVPMTHLMTELGVTLPQDVRPSGYIEGDSED